MINLAIQLIFFIAVALKGEVRNSPLMLWYIDFKTKTDKSTLLSLSKDHFTVVYSVRQVIIGVKMRSQFCATNFEFLLFPVNKFAIRCVM